MGLGQMRNKRARGMRFQCKRTSLFTQHNVGQKDRVGLQALHPAQGNCTPGIRRPSVPVPPARRVSVQSVAAAYGAPLVPLQEIFSG